MCLYGAGRDAIVVPQLPGKLRISVKRQGIRGACIKTLCIVEFGRYRARQDTSTTEARVGVICDYVELIGKPTLGDAMKSEGMQKSKRIERTPSLIKLLSE